MSLLITEAGIAASIRAGELGINYKIAEVSIGTEGYIPTADQTDLRNEIQRKLITRGELVSLGQLHFETVWDGIEEFEGKELGYWLDDGTLFAVDSRDGEVITYKQKDTVVTEACELNLAASTINNITVEVLNPYSATEERAGIAEIVTNEQVEEGTNDNSFLTVKKLVYALNVPHIIDKLVNNLWEPLIEKMWLSLSDRIYPVGAPIPWFSDVLPSSDKYSFMLNQAFDMQANPKLATVYPDGIIPTMEGLGLVGKESHETVGVYEKGQVKEHGHPNSSVSSTNLGSKNTNTDTHAHTTNLAMGAYADGRNGAGGLWGTNGGKNWSSSSDAHYHSVSIGSHAHTVVIALFGALKNTIDHRKCNFIVRMA
ncbi:phage tail protein [Vibrio splendidus]